MWRKRGIQARAMGCGEGKAMGGIDGWDRWHMVLLDTPRILGLRDPSKCVGGVG